LVQFINFIQVSRGGFLELYFNELRHWLIMSLSCISITDIPQVNLMKYNLKIEEPP